MKLIMNKIKMKIGVGLIFYDDLDSLKRCIPTLKVDTIYAIDGRFKDFNAPNPLSTDGSREYLQTFDNVVLIDAPDLSEVAKRNIYMKACKEEFLLWVDSDHWIEGDWDSFRKEIDKKVNKKNGYGYWFLTEDLTRTTIHYQCWGFYLPNNIQYRYRHDWYEAEGKRILPKSHNNKYTKLKSLKVFNDHSKRLPKRELLGKEWYTQSRIKELENTKNLTNKTNFSEKLKRLLLRF